MTRDFLKGLGIEDSIVDKIMAEHGANIQALKNDNDTLKTKIKSYDTDIATYKADIDKLNNTIAENNKSLENLKNLTNENKELKADIQLNGTNVKKEFSKFVRSEVMSKVDDKTDFTKALENYKKENPQFFGDTIVTKVQTSPSLNGGTPPQTTNTIMNNIIRGAKENN